jgi:hypothetical protein
MDNFDLRKYLAESKLHEAELPPLSDEQFEEIAQRIADELTAADDLDIKYSITPGSIENDTPLGGGFDLDAERGPNTPGDDWEDDRGFTIDQYVGEGDGGSYTVKPSPSGTNEYIVTNAAMMNTKVANVYFEGDTLEIQMVPQDEFLPRSSDEAEAQRKKEREMANVFVREEKKSNKMKKSELKEMIKSAILAEESYPDPEESGASVEDLYQMDQEMLDKLKRDKEDKKYPTLDDVVDPDDPFDEELQRAMDNDDMRDNMMEAKKDEDKEDKNDDVEVELEDETTEMEPETSDKGLTGPKKIVDDSLEAALEAARELGDEKLEAQIGNTITFFTRSQIVKNTSGEQEDAPEMDMETEEEMLQEEKVEEGVSIEEKRIAMSAVKRIAEYRGVSEDEARNDLIRAAEELGSPPQIHSAKDEQMYLNESVKRMQRIAGIIK